MLQRERSSFITERVKIRRKANKAKMDDWLNGKYLPGRKRRLNRKIDLFRTYLAAQERRPRTVKSYRHYAKKKLSWKEKYFSKGKKKAKKDKNKENTRYEHKNKKKEPGFIQNSTLEGKNGGYIAKA